MLRKYTLNQNYFDIIDTPEKAYWLGFLAADGNVYKNIINVSLQLTDLGHLYRFASAINRNAPILEKPCARISFSSKKMVDALHKHGIDARKSLNLLPWNGPADLMLYYWQGVFDGDGGIIKNTVKPPNKKSYPSWKVTLTGTFEIISAFREWLGSQGITKPGYLTKHSNVYRIEWGGTLQAFTILSCLYADDRFILERKLIRFAELREYHGRKITTTIKG